MAKDKDKKSKKKKRKLEEAAAMAAAVEREAAAAAAMAQELSPTSTADDEPSSRVPSMFGTSDTGEPSAHVDSVARTDPGPEADSVTRIDFNSSEDGVTRLDFSSPSGADGEGDSVIRLDFGSSVGGESDSVVRLDFSTPESGSVLEPTSGAVSEPALEGGSGPASAMPQASPAVQAGQQSQLRSEPVGQPSEQQPQSEVQLSPQPQHVAQQPSPQPQSQLQSEPVQQQGHAVGAVQPAAAGAVQSKPAELTDEEKAADRAQAANKPSPDEVTAAKNGLERIIDNVETVVIGKREPVSLVVLALVARGHVLLEDLPGTGKTTLVSALARSIACDFSRIQFTPDIMPSDVSGFSIYNQKTNDFEFRPGGVMSNLVLADEINRASAKTQSALLEAMEERQVTVDGKTYRLPEPFMVLATQNPIEQFGTYPLPEAQVDRFLVKLSMGYPGFDQEVRVLELGDKAKKALAPVVSGSNVLALREIANRVYASRIVLRYIVEVITATRDNPEVQVGSSPRGGIALLALARAYALLQGRAYVIPDDVKYLSPHVLCHRISLAHEAKVAGRTERQVIESILSGIAVPYYDEDEARGLK